MFVPDCCVPDCGTCCVVVCCAAVAASISAKGEPSVALLLSDAFALADDMPALLGTAIALVDREAKIKIRTKPNHP